MDTAARLVEDATDDAPLGVVAVRALCDFAARAGDLDLRFTPSPSGSEGVEGHGEVTSRRAASYQREVPLAMVCMGLRVQGRADGWDPDARRVEEIKTHRGDVALIAPTAGPCTGHRPWCTATSCASSWACRCRACSRAPRSPS